MTTLTRRISIQPLAGGWGRVWIYSRKVEDESNEQRRTRREKGPRIRMTQWSAYRRARVNAELVERGLLAGGAVMTQPRRIERPLARVPSPASVVVQEKVDSDEDLTSRDTEAFICVHCEHQFSTFRTTVQIAQKSGTYSQVAQ